MNARLAAAFLMLIGLAACGELPRPFQPEYKGEENARLMPVDRAGVVVRPIEGLPAPAAAAFNTALIDALRREDIAAMSGNGNAASLLLVGTADPTASGWDFTLALADAHSTPLGSITTYADPGTPEDPKSWEPYAAQLAKSFAAMLQTSGTQLGDQPRVTIGEIRGVPTAEGLALSRALEYTLKRSQVQIAETPNKATHIVTADVKVTPLRSKDGKDLRNIDVRWIVQRADHSEIGDVRQANDVPMALLERAWPDIAMAVAGSATGSIADLVNRPAASLR